MKVIKKAPPQKPWAKEYKCTGAGNEDRGCDATLLVEQDDLFYTMTCDMLGDETLFITFRCPECRALTDISPRRCPVDVDSLPSFKAWCAKHGVDFNKEK